MDHLATTVHTYIVHKMKLFSAILTPSTPSTPSLDADVLDEDGVKMSREIIHFRAVIAAMKMMQSEDVDTLHERVDALEARVGTLHAQCPNGGRGLGFDQAVRQALLKGAWLQHTVHAMLLSFVQKQTQESPNNPI